MNNLNINVTLFLFGIFKFRRSFLIKRERGQIFALYQIKNNQQIKVISLFDIIKKAKKSHLTDKQKFSRKSAVKYILKKAALKTQVRLDIGVVSAYTTAMICGLLFILSSAFDAVYRQPQFNMELSIKPLFSKQFFSIQANCIIALSVANIIIGYLIYKKNMRR